MGRYALIKLLSVFLLVLTSAALLSAHKAQAAPSIVSLSASTTMVNCNSGASIIATVTDPVGLASGQVNFTSSFGTITPYAPVTGGSAVAQYVAPATAGTAVITASINGSSTVQTSLTVTCNLNCASGVLTAGCNNTTCTTYGQPNYAYPGQYGTSQYPYQTQNQGCYSCGGYTALPCAGCTTYTPCSPNIQCSGANCGTSCVAGACTQVCTSITCGAACSYNTANSCGGPPAKVSIAAGGGLSCDSVAAISVTVLDAGGQPVPDGTSVSGTTSLGRISGPVVTKSGAATLTLLLGQRDAGTASITATSAGASGPGTFSVTCAAPPAAPQTTIAPSAPPVQTLLQPQTTTSAPPPPPPAAGLGGTSGAPTLRPPNTGDAGLLGLLAGDESQRTPA